METSDRGWLGGGVLLVALSAMFAGDAHAYSTGVVVPGCGCHSGGMVPEVKLLTPKNLPAPGETITLTVAIPAVNGDTGGFYFEQSEGGGTLMAGPGTRMPMAHQVVHSMPGRAAQGEVRFDISWKAPDMPAAAYFRVYAVSANGSGAPTGDNFGSTTLGVAVGCASADTYFYDSDKDGVGNSSLGMRPACAALLPLPGWSRVDGDCDENRAEVNPNMPEVCNLRDDDCDGKIDEGVENTVLYPDADGDGFGDPKGMPGQHCGESGFAPNNTDCDDRDANRHPGATESCNAYDEDCDGNVDERVRPSCGVGLCVRSSQTCMASDCTPGFPDDEFCNFLDDDCDGKVDEALNCDAMGSAAAAGASAQAAAGGGGAGATAGALSAPLPAPAPAAGTGGCRLGGEANAMLDPLAVVLLLLARWSTRRRQG